MAVKLTIADVEKTAKQAKLSLSGAEAESLRGQLEETLNVVSELGKLDTSKVTGADRVTDTKNVFREDAVNEKRMLTQKQALSNIPGNKQHEGFFMVDAVFEDKDV